MSYISGMKKSSMTLLMITRFYIIHMTWIDCYSTVFLYTYVDDYTWKYFLYTQFHLYF